MENHADSLLKICKAEEVDTGTYTLDCRQMGPAEEKSDIQQHELLRARHSRGALILESLESSDGCILDEEIAPLLELLRETLKVLRGLKLDIRERRREARKRRMFCHEHFGYSCRKEEEANISTTLDKILTIKGCNPWKHAQNLRKILFTKNELKYRILSPQKKTSREVKDCERSNLVKEANNTQFPGQRHIARSAIDQLGRNVRSNEKNRYLKHQKKTQKETEPIAANLARISTTTIECYMKSSRTGRRTPFFLNK